MRVCERETGSNSGVCVRGCVCVRGEGRGGRRASYTRTDGARARLMMVVPAAVVPLTVADAADDAAVDSLRQAGLNA